MESHKKFVEQYKLNFDLLADTDKKLSQAYGSLMQNGMSARNTIIISPEGKVLQIDKNVNGQFDRTDKGLGVIMVPG